MDLLVLWNYVYHVFGVAGFKKAIHFFNFYKCYIKDNDDIFYLHNSFVLPDRNYDKNGVLWSQARMRIEMRLRYFLVIGNL